MGEDELAIEEFTRIGAETHSFPVAYERLIVLHEKLGQPEKARIARQHLQQANNSAINYQIHLAYLALRNGNLVEARAVIDRIIPEAPDHIGTLTSMADIMSGIGMFDQAMDFHRRSLELGGQMLISEYQKMLRAKGYDAGYVEGHFNKDMQAALEKCVRENCLLSY